MQRSSSFPIIDDLTNDVLVLDSKPSYKDAASNKILFIESKPEYPLPNEDENNLDTNLINLSIQEKKRLYDP